MTRPEVFREELIRRIAADGPIPLDQVMAEANAVYYGQGDVFGAKGDFITAPEISQTFGEMIGLWAAVTWQSMGSPSQVRLIECGPGRGTLMADLLRAARADPSFAAAIDLHLIEQSERLRALQRESLRGAHAVWHETIATVPAGPTLVVANEFLDALPIRQFERTANGWSERCVTHDASSGFAFTTRPCDAAFALDAPSGAIQEQSPAIAAFIGALAARLAREGGAALLIDYGYAQSAVGDTLQAVHAHRYHPVLENLGGADLTAHVDFSAVAAAATAGGARVHGPVDQGTWLERLGIGARLAKLSAGKTTEVQRSLESGVQRLTDPRGMGSLFKAMALTHSSLTPEGFL
ncbi:MAG: class I SAM-dependent methyltransferase [Candidatus Binataceae bacterium]